MWRSSETFMKSLSLGLLVPHTVLYTLLAAVARRPDTHGNIFFGPAAVAVMELGKALLSLGGVFLTHAKADTPRDENIGQIEEYSLTITQNRGILKEDLRTSSEPPFSQDEIRRDSTDGLLPLRTTSGDTTKRPLSSTVYLIYAEVCNTKAFRLCPAAIVYVIQNNLQVLAAGYLSPAEYQVVGQTKLAFTAIFSILILGRKLNRLHWLAIFLLGMGTTAVQSISILLAYKSQGQPLGDFPSQPLVKTISRTPLDLIFGTVVMLGASLCSGLGGVLVESLLKGKKTNFWTTNVHLATFSFIPALIPVITESVVNKAIDPFRFFHMTVWCLIGLNILGGIIASMTMKYADNILKNFAVAISLVITVLLSNVVSGVPVHWAQAAGTSLVAVAIWIYARV